MSLCWTLKTIISTPINAIFVVISEIYYNKKRFKYRSLIKLCKKILNKRFNISLRFFNNTSYLGLLIFYNIKTINKQIIKYRND